MSTGSPQSIPIKTHSFLKAKTHTNTWRPFCHTAHTRAHLISCVGGVTTRHRNHIRFKPSSASVQPYGPLHRTGVQCLINRHGLTFDLLPRPQASSRGSKVTTASGTRPPIAEAKSQAPISKHWPVKPRPIGSNKTCINAHAHTPHSARNTPTCLIRPNKAFFFFFFFFKETTQQAEKNLQCKQAAYTPILAKLGKGRQVYVRVAPPLT